MTEIGNVGLKPGIRDGFRDQTVYKCWGSRSNKTILLLYEAVNCWSWAIGSAARIHLSTNVAWWHIRSVLCYLLLWMYCLENKVLTFVSDKNYTEYNCTTSITGQRPPRSLQTSASISSLPFSSSSSLSWKSFVSEISSQEIKQMIYWQLFCVQIYFFTPPKFIVPTFLPFSPYLPKSYFGQGWARAVLQKIAITIRIQRVTMSTKVVTMNINSSEKYSPRHLGIVASSSLWLSAAPLLINAGIWQTNKVLWSAMSLSGPMVLSACPSGILTAEDDDVIL